jgi:hypothetical protein
VSKSYKSAVPTWTTYTPYVSPISTQAPINQEVLWRNRARQYSPPGIQGQLNRIAMGIDAQVKGTGAQHDVHNILANRPFLNEANRHAGPARNLWARRMQEAVQMGTPETMTEAGEAEPLTERQVRTARTAPSSVNPADMQQQAAARDVSGTLMTNAVGSSKMGTETLNVGPAAQGPPPQLWTPRLQPNRIR